MTSKNYISSPHLNKNTDNSFISRLVTRFDRSMFSLAGGAGPWVVPIAPALIYGHTFYDGTRETLGVWGIVGAVSMAIGLVVAGATSSHTAMALQSAGAPKSKVFWAWFLVFAYIVLEIGGIVTMNKWHSIEVVGVTASLLTLVVYLSRSFKRYLDEFKLQQVEIKTEQKEEKSVLMEYRMTEAKEKAEFERQKQLEEMRLEHQEKLAKIEASKEKALAKSVSGTVSGDVSAVQPDSTASNRVSVELLNDPNQNKTHLANRLGVSRATVQRQFKALKDDGKIALNGDGYKVLEPVHLNGNGAGK